LGNDFPQLGENGVAKRGLEWREAPDEGYSLKDAAFLRPHQSPAVTASPVRGKPSDGKLISVARCKQGWNFRCGCAILKSFKYVVLNLLRCEPERSLLWCQKL